MDMSQNFTDGPGISSAMDSFKNETKNNKGNRAKRATLGWSVIKDSGHKHNYGTKLVLMLCSNSKHLVSCSDRIMTL